MEKCFRKTAFRCHSKTRIKNIIPAGKSDVISYNLTVPSWVQSPLTVTTIVNYRKLNQRYALWSLGDLYQEIPVVEMARDTAQIAIKIQPPSISKNADSALYNKQ
ncbi:hypothetical protein [Pelagibaculum spongiae]|uniref:Uncharacterized protein n=1 Tax=Pelagibaculum spongiae TaxID=2080658 RepID=A0A2V1GWK2_9GAMM|nr:hypothetical protein [Pelagibaculum spongiae]PVZ63529.1 hypothetical protein DC094_20820 [Pelagibaculum spongiae]